MNEKLKLMKLNIILSGVGGQGILSIAAVIGQAVLKEGLYVKQAEVHGMSQRGGDVQSNLRISSEPIYSDLISVGDADIVISLEPMEALRYKHFLKPTGFLVTNTTPFINIPTYPELENLNKELDSIENIVKLDLETIAKDLGTAKATNMVLLGAASHFLHLEFEKIEQGVEAIFARKGETIVESNLNALREGRKRASEQLKTR